MEVTGLAIAGTAQLTLGPSGAAVQATSAPIGGAPLFQIVGPPTFPATLGPGMDLPVTVQLMTTGASLPAAPTNKDTGCTLLTANLTATLELRARRRPPFTDWSSSRRTTRRRSARS